MAMLFHPWYARARSALTLIVFSGCVTPAASRIEPPEPKQSTHYFSSLTAKLLGSDTSKSLDYRLIDPAIYTGIVQENTLTHPIVDPAKIQQLKTNSVEITVDNQKIQSDLQWVRDLSMKNKVEYQIYLYIDTTGLVSSAHGQPGTDSSSSPEYYYEAKTGTAHPFVDSIRRDWILIGQVHGHPDRTDSSQPTAHHMSSLDSITAQCLQIPVYAVDAMGKDSGSSGKMHRVLPNITFSPADDDTHIGSTRGNGVGAKNTINIGVQALWIWGNSNSIDTACLNKNQHKGRKIRSSQP
jgi:hypothetical protein